MTVAVLSSLMLLASSEIGFEVKATPNGDGTRSSKVTVAGVRSALPDGSTGVRSSAATSDGKYVFFVHGLGRYHLPVTQLDRGWVSCSAMSVFDGKSGKRINTVLLDDPARGAANPYDVAVNDRWIVIAHAGTHELSVIDCAAFFSKLLAYDRDATVDLNFLRGLRRRVKFRGNGPRKVRFRDDGKVEVRLHFSKSRAIVDPVTLETVEEEPNLPTDLVKKGEMYFHDASICYQGWQSCASCHLDGRDDGLTWDFPESGGGLGNTEKTVDLGRFKTRSAGKENRDDFIVHNYEAPDDVRAAVNAYIRFVSSDGGK